MTAPPLINASNLRQLFEAVLAASVIGGIYTHLAQKILTRAGKFQTLEVFTLTAAGTFTTYHLIKLLVTQLLQ